MFDCRTHILISTVIILIHEVLSLTANPVASKQYWFTETPDERRERLDRMEHHSMASTYAKHPGSRCWNAQEEQKADYQLEKEYGIPECVGYGEKWSTFQWMDSYVGWCTDDEGNIKQRFEWETVNKGLPKVDWWNGEQYCAKVLGIPYVPYVPPY